ncbi:MAG: arsenate reductase family protein [Sphaerochaeta sp.]|uniref:arsenate reductase family protein n=1 Tax=Sphaerochaeta sp. TaxID=1972642 RepID=UPI003D0E66A9
MIQIIGTKKCKETAKAIRTCKEQRLEYQFVDLTERALSEGEWRSIFQGYEPLSLIDSQSSYYTKEGYAFREFDPQEELKEHPQLLKTPILRSKGRVHVGFSVDILTSWGTN